VSDGPEFWDLSPEPAEAAPSATESMDAPDVAETPAAGPGTSDSPGASGSAVPRASIEDDLAWLSRHPRNRDRSYDGSRSRHHHSRGRSGRSRRGRTRHHWYRPRNTILLPALVIVLLVAGFLLYVNHELGAIRRGPLNATYGGAASTGTNVLLIASDAPTGAVQADARTMTVQLVHLGAGGDTASLIDIPRDLMLPAAAGESRATVAVRYLRVGSGALAADLQVILGITIAHVVQVDYAGYVRASDRLGGVDVHTETGIRRMSGAAVRDYVDQAGLPGVVAGQRNQHWLRGIIEGALTPAVLLNPFRIIGLLHDMVPNLVVDEALTSGAIRSLAWHSRGLSPSQTRYLTVPYRRYAPVKGGTVLLPDLPAMRQLGAAVRADNDSGIAVFDN